MTEERPLILITNDDGYQAKGIRELADVARGFGEVVVVAPEQHYSGASHSVTMGAPLCVKYHGKINSVDYYTVNGTPVDCVKMAKFVVCHGRKIDMVLSGINHGANAAISVIYSGTVAAAIEGSLDNCKSIGISYCDLDEDADFTASKYYAGKLIEKVLADDNYPNNITLNVNVPKLPLEEIKGFKVVSQARGFWSTEFEENVDPTGQKYYWLSGKMEDHEKKPGSCLFELANGYVTIQPVHCDMTAYDYIDNFKKLEL